MKIANKKESICMSNLVSICQCYDIPNEVEFVIPNYEESCKSSMHGFICVTKFMLKVGVKLSFKFDIAKVLNTFMSVPAPLLKTVARVELLEGSKAPKVYIMTMEESAKEEVYMRGCQGMSSKRPFAQVKAVEASKNEEILTKVLEESKRDYNRELEA
ncbi:hypothetical protein ACLOJK_003619 [Asimina triloba]